MMVRVQCSTLHLPVDNEMLFYAETRKYAYQLDVQRVTVYLTEHRDGLDPQFPCGSYDTAGNFASDLLSIPLTEI